MQQTYILQDTNFLVSAISTKDKFHLNAAEYISLMTDYDVTYIYPQLVINETIFTLMKSDFENDIVRDRISNLSMTPRVIIQQNDTLTTLRHTSSLYNRLFKEHAYGVSHLTNTSDYIIGCNALDFNAVVLTGDKQILGCLPHHGIQCFDYTKRKDYDKFKSYLQNNIN